MTSDLTTTRGQAARKRWQPFRLMLVAALAILMPRAGAAQAAAFEVIHSFKGRPDDGATPRAGVVIGPAGALYGTTLQGGTSLLGTVFQLTHTTGGPWKETVLHNFSGPDGSYPSAGLVFGSRGVLYGTTAAAAGVGTIFELAPPSAAGGAWTETLLYTFEDRNGNNSPAGAVLIGPGGTLYATTQGSGEETSGTAIALLPPSAPGGLWTASVIYSFGGAAGSSPLAGLVSEGGALFGTDNYEGDEYCYGSANGCGVVYQLTPMATAGGAWTETTIHTFTGSPGDGAGSKAALTVGPGGVLYGTTQYGGSGTPCDLYNLPGAGCGTVFQLIPPAASGGTWTESVIYSFTGGEGDGAYPSASIVVGKDGALYGTTQYGGSATSGSPCSYYGASGCGTVFELTPPATPGGAWTEKVLHSFSGRNGDGSSPVAGLALSSSGVLYGTTAGGGAAGEGTVFAVEP